jgi:hypothetical protein
MRAGKNCHNFTIEVNLEAFVDALVSSYQTNKMVGIEKMIDSQLGIKEPSTSLIVLEKFDSATISNPITEPIGTIGRIVPHELMGCG